MEYFLLKRIPFISVFDTRQCIVYPTLVIDLKTEVLMRPVSIDISVLKQIARTSHQNLARSQSH